MARERPPAKIADPEKTPSIQAKRFLRAALADVGASTMSLASASGIPYATVNRTLDPKYRNCNVNTVDTLLRALGYRLVLRLERRDDYASIAARYSQRVPLPEAMLDG